MGELTLILGGARSGKSDLAQRLAAASGGSVLYVATAERGDTEMTARIAAHRAERPQGWPTLEEPLRVVEALEGLPSEPGTFVLLDCLTLWMSNLLLRGTGESAALAEVMRLLDWQARTGCAMAIVSNEVGMGIVPDSAPGRDYRDLLGRANRMCARRADRTLLTVAGMAVDLRAAGAQPIEEFGPGLGQVGRAE